MTPVVRIPSHAVADSAWMRVGVFYHADFIKPCNDGFIYDYGNTVDHKILLRDAAVVRIDAEGRTTPIQGAPNPVWQASLAYGTCEPVVGTTRPFAGGFSGLGPTLKVTLETCSGPADFTPHVSYRWRVLDAFAATPDSGSGSFDGWQGRIRLGLPKHVQKTQTLLTFDLEDGDHNVLRTGQAVTLDTYVGYDVAGAMPELAAGGLKQQWLDRAVAWGSGGATPLELGHRLNDGVYGEGADFYRDVDPAWTELVSMGGAQFISNCVTVSNLWAACARMLGMPLATTDRTRGAYGRGFVTRPGSSASFDAGQTGNCGPEPSLIPDRWRFGMHQVGMVPGSGSPRYFDPTFGVEYANFPDDVVLWNLLSVVVEHGNKPAVPTDEGHVVFMVERKSEEYPWAFFNFSPVPAPGVASLAVSAAGSSTIDGPGTWTTEDPNGDDAYDNLRWDGTITFTDPTGSRFALAGAIFADTLTISDRPSDSAVMPSVAPLVTESSGTYAVTMRFSGEEIRSAGVSGSLLGRFWLVDSSGTILDTLTSATPVVSAPLFGERAVRLGQVADVGLDRDGSGLLDDIEVDIPISVQFDCDVRVVARATDPYDSTLISTADTTFAASAGASTVRLALQGTDFIRYGVDGPYDLRTEVQAAGHPPEISEATSQSYLLSSFDGPAVAPIGPTGYANPVDTNLDGQVESLAWELPVYCLRAGAYQTSGVLADQYGVPIVSAHGLDTLATGYAYVHLVFTGDAIAASGRDPYYVIGVRTLGERGLVCMDDYGFFIDGSVDHNVFAPFVRLGTTFTSAASDTGADGYLDVLDVSCSVTNVRTDTARIFVDALLHAPSGQVIASGRGESAVPPSSTAPIQLRFDGRAISVAGASGPYTVGQLSVASDRDGQRPFGHLVYVEQAHTTSAYDRFRFSPAPHVFGLVEDNGVPVPGASVRMVLAGEPAVPDSTGAYHLGTPDLLPGTFDVTMGLPVGHDTTDWRVLKDGQEFALGRSASVTFESTETIRLDFVRGAALTVPWERRSGDLLIVRRSSRNPVRSGTSLRYAYDLARPAALDVSVFDVNGRRVIGPLAFTRAAAPGTIEVPVYGASRRALPSGVYLVRIIARSQDGGRGSWVGRLVVLN